MQADRTTTAERYAREHRVVVVLKGAETVVAAPGDPAYVDRHRVVALATGGTGDVLAGLIGSMLSQGLTPRDAAVAGVTIHAQAGSDGAGSAGPRRRDRLRRDRKPAGRSGAAQTGDRGGYCP